MAQSYALEHVLDFLLHGVRQGNATGFDVLLDLLNARSTNNDAADIIDTGVFEAETSTIIQ